jgi:hypothetical protein
MIQIVMKPQKAPVVNRETLYAALVNGRDIGLRVRGLRASHAEAKLVETLEESGLARKDPVSGTFTIDFDLEKWLGGKGGANADNTDNTRTAENP